jgi:hypothetical protein
MANLIHYDANMELGQQKPEQWQDVDLEHALLRGCAIALPLNENAGSYVYDVIHQNRWIIAGTASWSAVPGGLTEANAGNSLNCPAFPNQFDPSATPHTVLIDFVASALPQLYNNLWLVQEAGNLNEHNWGIWIANDGSLQIGDCWLGTRCASASGLIAVGKRSKIAVTFDASNDARNIHIYLNGVLVSHVIDYSDARVAAVANWCLGFDYRGNTTGFNGTYFDFRAYARILGVQEIWTWAQEPWAAFVASSSLAWQPDAAAYSAVLFHLAQLCAA